MRNRLAHAYFNLDLTLLWEVVAYELPPLIEAVRSIIEEDFG